MNRGVGQTLHRKDMWMENKHIKTYLVSLVIKKLQIKATTHWAEWLKLKILTIASVHEDGEKLQL